MSVKAVSPLLLKRYELKYLVPFEMVEPMSKFIEGHCQMDYYSQIAPDHFYVINSLYFDTPNYQFLARKRAGIEPTWNMRVRSYGPTPKPPYFTEIKLKVNDFSNKMRAKLECEDWKSVLIHGEMPPEIDSKSKDFLHQFLFLLRTHNAEPKVLTQYRRKAYLSEIDNYARVTFDRDLRFQREEGFNVTPDEAKMCHYDIEDIYPHPEDNVIVELKCEKRIPLWMIQFIKHFDLSRRGFSKYGNAINTIALPLDPPFDLQPAQSLLRFHSEIDAP